MNTFQVSPSPSTASAAGSAAAAAATSMNLQIRSIFIFFILSIVQVFSGCLCIVFMSVVMDTCNHKKYPCWATQYESGYGFWCGCVFLVTGTLGTIMHKTSKRGLVKPCTTMNGISCIFCCILISLSIIDASSPMRYQIQPSSSTAKRRYVTKTVMTSLLAFLGFIEVFSSTICLSIGMVWWSFGYHRQSDEHQATDEYQDPQMNSTTTASPPPPPPPPPPQSTTTTTTTTTTFTIPQQPQLYQRQQQQQQQQQLYLKVIKSPGFRPDYIKQDISDSLSSSSHVFHEIEIN